MTEFVIKAKGIEKWLGMSHVFCMSSGMTENKINSLTITKEQSELLYKLIDFEKKYVTGYCNISIPNDRYVTNLSQAFKTDEHCLNYLNEVLHYLKAHIVLIDLGISNSITKKDIYQGHIDRIIKSQKNLEKRSELVPRSIEGAVINKKAWAIFVENRKKTGYFVSNNSNFAELSGAKLFDSDVGCARQAKKLAVDKYEIVEVDIQLKKRSEHKSGNIDALDAAFAILEKQKLEQFFSEIDHSKIEEKLQQIKAKPNKI